MVSGASFGVGHVRNFHQGMPSGDVQGECVVIARVLWDTPTKEHLNFFCFHTDPKGCVAGHSTGRIVTVILMGQDSMAPSTAHHSALKGVPPCGGGATPPVSGTAARELQQSLSPASVVLCSPVRHIYSPNSSDISSANLSSGSPIPWYESVSHCESASNEPCTVSNASRQRGPQSIHHLRCTGRISLFAHLQGPQVSLHHPPHGANGTD